jgi:hypothetical protein
VNLKVIIYDLLNHYLGAFFKVKLKPPPSVTPLNEWTLYSPKDGIALPKSAITQVLGFICANKITNPLFKVLNIV